MSEEQSSEEKKLVVNVEENSGSLKISDEIYLRILQKAVTQTTEDIKEFDTALPVNDHEKIVAISHKWKGDYDNLRITAMSSLAKEINVMAKEAQDANKEKIADLMNQFKQYFEQLKELINQNS